MEKIIIPNKYHGTIKAPSSKSQAHRYLICSALASGESHIVCHETSNDIEATKKALLDLGSTITMEEDGYRIQPMKLEPKTVNLTCGDSGATFRFLLPIVGALGGRYEFRLQGRLPDRPISPLYEEMQVHGINMSPKGSNPFFIEGKLTPGHYALSANVSSQFISGLLFALPLLSKNSTLEMRGMIESSSYIQMTLDAIARYGIKIEKLKNHFYIQGGQQYISPERMSVVEGDWSNAAFWLCMGAMSKEGIRCENLNLDSSQGDKIIVELLRAFGADVQVMKNAVVVKRKELNGIVIDARNIPDLVPTLAAVASVAKGETRIMHAERLRLKESDRLATVEDTLNRMGASVVQLPDGLLIKGRKGLIGGKIDSHGDHRIAMMAAISAMNCKEPVTIFNAEAVSKSYPRFFEDLEELNEFNIWS